MLMEQDEGKSAELIMSGLGGLGRPKTTCIFHVDKIKEYCIYNHRQ